jgi:hypothetical protein
MVFVTEENSGDATSMLPWHTVLVTVEDMDVNSKDGGAGGIEDGIWNKQTHGNQKNNRKQKQMKPRGSRGETNKGGKPIYTSSSSSSQS